MHHSRRSRASAAIGGNACVSAKFSAQPAATETTSLRGTSFLPVAGRTVGELAAPKLRPRQATPKASCCFLYRSDDHSDTRMNATPDSPVNHSGM